MKLLTLLLALALTACGGGSTDDGATPEARSTAPAHATEAAAK